MPDDLEADEMDPTQPPRYGDEVVEVADGQHEDEEQAWTPQDGLVDGTGTVRVWVDDEGHLERVQLARYWREQNRQVPLEELFAEVFLQITVLFAPSLLRLPQPEKIETDELLSSELIAEVTQAMAELDRQAAELETDDSEAAQWHGQSVTGIGEEGRVRLTLNIFGSPVSVDFDDKWLAEAGSAQVHRGVLAAYADARAKFVEPTFVPSEHDRIAVEYLTLSERLQQAGMRGIAGIATRPEDLPPDSIPTPGKEKLA